MFGKRGNNEGSAYKPDTGAQPHGSESPAPAPEPETEAPSPERPDTERLLIGDGSADVHASRPVEPERPSGPRRKSEDY